MKRACVIGWPIEHSRSPLIHGYWLRRYGIDGAYTRKAVRPDDLAEFLRALKEHNYVGCNVTVPHKEMAYQVAEEAEESARVVEAANTLWLDHGRLWAANTDTYGFMTYLSETVPDWRAYNGPVSILGAGGAARAIVYGFLEAGVDEIRVFNRTRVRAEAIARQFGPRVKVYDWSQRESASRGASVLVNTTSVGMKGRGSPDIGIGFSGFDPRSIVCDIVYVPLETDMLAAARAAGLRTVDGLGMLLHQAVPGFEKWFGVRPEVTPELRALVIDDIAGHA
jgi:shikimate dehydrogenase